MAPIRVLQIFGSLNMGGAETRMMDIYRGLDREKYAFDFLTMDLSEQYYEAEIRNLGGRIFKIPPPRVNPLANLRAIEKILRENGPYDAVHAHTSFHCGFAVLAAARADVPVRIAHSRTTGSKQGGAKQKMMLTVGRALIARYATHRLAISEAAARYLFGKNALQKQNVRVLPNAIDTTPYFSSPDCSVVDLYESFGLCNNDFILGHIGRFAPMKNQAFLLDLYRAVLEKKQNARLVFIGDGSMRAEIEAKAAQYGLTDRVVFTGVRNDVYRWLHLFDVVVMPSLYEGLCGVAIEAQAAGTPCVLSDAIPQAETDLQLGLTRYLPLTAPQSDWVDAVLAAESLPKVPQTTIERVFDERGYTADSARQAMCAIYSSRKDA